MMEHVIAKLYKLLLKCEVEEQVKECILKWIKNFGYNALMEQWKNMWPKGLKL